MTVPRPFLKWAGGKTQLLSELIKRIPPSWNRETDLYVEPFLGAGALFWALQPKHAILNDSNADLICAWWGLRFTPNAVLPQLMGMAAKYAKSYKDASQLYYLWRTFQLDSVKVPGSCAARMIFLNKTCFNGLYRVNKAGDFNVPWGKNPNAAIYDGENLRACVNLLRQNDIVIQSADFGTLANTLPAGSLVYFDPPYHPVSDTANFTAYTQGGFTYYDQLRLAVHAKYLKECGCHVMLSQSAFKPLIDQYRRLGFTCDRVKARRAINSKGSSRGAVGEYIIY